MYYNSTLTILSHEFNLDKVKQKISSLELRDKYHRCGLVIAIDYQKQIFTIELKHDNDEVILIPNTEISLNPFAAIRFS